MTASDEFGDLTLLGKWKLGNHDAASEFYQRYAEKLLSLIQRNIARRFASRFDAADIAQSVMRTFFGAAADGRLRITPNDDVWKLLQTIALNKVRTQVRFHDAAKRKISRTAIDTDLATVAGEPSEQDAIEITDLFESTIKSFDPKVAEAIRMLLEGHSQDDISKALDVTTRTVRRYRDQFADELARAFEL